ncbi:MAG TPA: hypothetical protein VL027_13705, partial [Spongiibacteraceae bacterium]|nr:hypothetical protein [Spongiibacteraceae bacterium]
MKETDLPPRNLSRRNLVQQSLSMAALVPALSDEHPVPTATQVKLDRLHQHLPPNVKKISKECRMEQIR